MEDKVKDIIKRCEGLGSWFETNKPKEKTFEEDLYYKEHLVVPKGWKTLDIPAVAHYKLSILTCDVMECNDARALQAFQNAMDKI